MYTKGDKNVSIQEAQESAAFSGFTVEEWAKNYGWSLNETETIGPPKEGKTNGSTETPPTEPVKNTAAGDSSSADISLESLEEFDLSNLPKIVKETDTYMGVNSDFDVSDVRGPEKPLSKKILRFAQNAKEYTDLVGEDSTMPMDIDNTSTNGVSDPYMGQLAAQNENGDTYYIQASAPKAGKKTNKDIFGVSEWGGTPTSTDDDVKYTIIDENLETPAKESNLEYNVKNSENFVNTYYGEELSELGINKVDFEGWLNNKGFSYDFEEDIADGTYTSKAYDGYTKKGDVTKEEMLNLQKEEILERFLFQYIQETQEKAEKQTAIQDYSNNPKNYDNSIGFNDIYSNWSTDNSGEAIYDYDKIKEYAGNKFAKINKFNKKIDTQLTQEYNEYIKKGNLGELNQSAGQTLSSAFNEFTSGGIDAIRLIETKLAKSIGISDSFVERSRIYESFDEKKDLKQLNYISVKGKQINFEGTNYIVDKDGGVYNIDAGFRVNRVLDDNKLSDIAMKANAEGVEATDISGRGSSAALGGALGGIAWQVLAARGAGLARVAASTEFMAAANGFKNVKKYKKYMSALNKAGDRRGMNPLNIKNSATFGVKLPFNPGIVDATLSQTFYGATTGYEQTIKEAKAAGLNNAEAEMLANQAMIETGALYGLTGWINPRLPAMRNLDKLLSRNKVVNKAVRDYLKAGKSTKTFTETLSDGLAKITPQAKAFLQEGAKEVVQENIQQVGEFKIVNKRLNEAAGVDFMKDTYSAKDIIETSALSFVAAGLLGGANFSNVGFKQTNQQRLVNLIYFSKDLKNATNRLNVMVDAGRISREGADEIIQQAAAVGKQQYHIPLWMKDTDTDLVEVATLLQSIDDMKADKKKVAPSMHRIIDESIAFASEKVTAIYDKAATELTKKDVETATNIVGKENIVTYNTTAEMEKAGFTEQQTNADGFTLVDGKIIINLEKASQTQAFSVGSHELLHSILRSEMRKNVKEMPRIINELRNILKEKGILEDIEKRMAPGIKSGTYDIKFNKDGTVSGSSIDEYFNFLSDAIRLEQIPLESIGENNLLRIGRLIANIIKTRFGKIDKKFENGQQVFDFIRDYQTSIKKGKLSYTAKLKKKSSDSLTPETQEETDERNRIWKAVKETDGTKLSYTEDSEFKAANKADLFTVTTNVFNEATELYGLGLKLNKDGTPAFTKAEWDNIPDNTKLGVGFMLGETWKPYVSYLMGSRRDVPGFDEYASQIIERTSSGIERGDDGIPFLVKTYNPEAGAKLSSYIFGQVGRRLQGAINKQEGFGEITVDAVSDKPGAKELVQKESIASTEDVPKYKNLVRRRIVTPVAIANIESKIIPILRVLKTRMDASVSKNVTSKPWVNELRLQLGKQLDLVIKQEMGGVKGGELRRFLLKNKTAILENMTTSYLTKAMPFAVQKSVSGVYTSNWQGQKIDRETTTTQKAGRTSGNELVRRLPKAALRISDAEFLASVVGPGGNPIRGRKEALAKAIAEELSLDIIAEALKDPKSKISEAFEQNQERLGVSPNENVVNEVLRDFERGTIKYSDTAGGNTGGYANPPVTKDDSISTGDMTEAQDLKNQEQMRKFGEKSFNNILDDNKLKNILTLNTVENQKEAAAGFLKLGPGLPKRFWRKAANSEGVISLTKSAKVLGSNVKTNSDLHNNWKKIVFDLYNDMEKQGFANNVEGQLWTMKLWKPLAGNYNDFIKNKKQIEKNNIENAKHHKAMFEAFFKLIKADKENATAVAQYLQLSANDSQHYHRMGFALVGVEEGFIAGRGKGTFEHALNSLGTALYLFDAMLAAADPKSGLDFNEAYETIMAQSKVVGVTNKSDKKLVGEYKNGMGSGWDLTQGWWLRYENAGIDISKIATLTDDNLKELTLTPEGAIFAKSQALGRPSEVAENLKIVENSSYSVTERLDLNKAINEMIERQTGVSEGETFANVDARMMGKNIGKYDFFAPGADDFRGLTAYTFAGKGKQGDADQKFFEDNLVKPYQRGVAAITFAKQTVKKDFAFIVKTFSKQAKMMSETVPGTKYTYDQALRVYLWQRQGMEVPGIKPKTVRNLSRAISENLGLIEFANATLLASKQAEWMAPTEFWATETVLSGLYNMTENLGRKVYLAEFIENADIIFSPENLNKMEALYGSKYRSALEDSLYRMKNGTNRNSGSDATTNRWNNWVNQSTGAIMFFNRRSAVLQTLSIANFTNWSDNNPVKQAMAFANQKQYWADFAMIFNSPKLKERRSGLKNDVNASELANAAKGETNKAAAVLNKMLELGFKPTQIADSFAIAAGGAAFYRNRVNTYLKQDMSLEAAEKLAFEEFSSNADESQQSSDPMLVSQQQASVLGRLVLAFQNTPMQYTRLMKKAGQDIINGRGDFKTNMSKILYYGAIQNLIFASLQSALFAFIPGYMDDEDGEEFKGKLEGKELRVFNSMMDSLLKGSGLTGAVLATIKNTIMELYKQDARGYNADFMYVTLQVLGISPPIGSKIRKMYNSYQTYRFEKDSLSRGASVVANGRVNLSPWYSIVGNLAAGTLNIPGDRIVDQVTSMSEALDSRNSQWQRLALAMGWKTWDVGAKNEEADLLKLAGKKKRKTESKAKAKATRAKNKTANQKPIRRPGGSTGPSIGPSQN